MPLANSIDSIRTRLFALLIRAFGTVVIATLALILVTTIITLGSSNQMPAANNLSLSTRLQDYYADRGNWEDVHLLRTELNPYESLVWENSILLDAEGNVLSRYGEAPQTLQKYQPAATETIIPLSVHGQVVGSLVLSSSSKMFSWRWLIVAFTLVPVFIVSIFLAILTTLIGLFLTRRVVAPLAEVIAAAQEVSRGNLAVRVMVKGPDDLQVLGDSFNQMASTLERNEQERKDLLADVAHELRTPLTILRGRLEGIMDGVYQADEKHISTALESTYMLENLVDDLQLLALAESGQLPFEKKEIDLVELAQKTVEIFSAQVNEKGITLSLETKLDKVLLVLDPVRIEQILGNLLNNALQNIPSGSRVWLTIEKKESDMGEALIRVTIADDGPGLPAEDIPFIFNRFWRKEKSRSRMYGGSGLGLAITRQLVEAQGGSIEAGLVIPHGLKISIQFKQ